MELWFYKFHTIHTIAHFHATRPCLKVHIPGTWVLNFNLMYYFHIPHRRFISQRYTRRLSYKASIESLQNTSRPRTCTVVDMNDLSPPPNTPPGIITKQGATSPRHVTTSFVQFKDLDEEPCSPHRTNGHIPNVEFTEGAQMRSHQHVARLPSCPDMGSGEDCKHKCEVGLSRPHSMRVETTAVQW